MEETNKQKLCLKVECTEKENGHAEYNVIVAEGMSIAEVGFCMAVTIKCLLRDGAIKDAQEIYNYIGHYLDTIEEEVVQDD